MKQQESGVGSPSVAALDERDRRMTLEDARARYNFLLTLCTRKAESFGPMAYAFVKNSDIS